MPIFQMLSQSESNKIEQIKPMIDLSKIKDCFRVILIKAQHRNAVHSINQLNTWHQKLEKVNQTQGLQTIF